MSEAQPRRGRDPLATASAVVAVGAAVVHGFLLQDRGDRPALWFVGCLAVAASLVAYGATRPSTQRIESLVGGGAVLAVLGVLSLPSIGWALLVAAALAGAAAWRARAVG